MKLALYMPKTQLRSDDRFKQMLAGLEGCGISYISSSSDLDADTDILLSIGGDGTYLSAADIALDSHVPVLGVNFGRLGFLSDCPPEDAAAAIMSGDYLIEDREMLECSVDGGAPMHALNEVAVTRIGTAMLGVDVCVNGEPLPTFWADGLLVATSSGSTAYSLSVGGPICTPDSQVHIIAPVAPHNLNVRPLIVPSTARLDIALQSRNEEVTLALDNRDRAVGRDTRLAVSMAQFSLKRVRLPRINFITALRTKLFWGEDVRNESV